MELNNILDYNYNFPMTRFLFLIIINTIFFFSTVSAETLIQGKPNYKNIDEWLVFGQKHLRRAYRMGGTGPYAFDCSGFTMYMFKELTISLPHNSVEQSKYGEKVSVKHAEKGDLVFYAGSKGSAIGHVGIIYEVNDDETFTFIHASTSQGVIIDSSEHPYYKSRFKQIRRVTSNDDIADALGITKKKEVSNHEKEEKKEVKLEKVEKEESVRVVDEPKKEVVVRPIEEKPQVKKKRGAKRGLKNRLKKNDDKGKETLNIEPKKAVVVEPAVVDTTVVVEPKSEPQKELKHIVSKGETLYSISKKYGVSVDEIKNWNNLNSNAISVGQELIIKN